VNADHKLLRRVVEALRAQGVDFEAAVPLTGMSREWNRAVLAEEWPAKLNRPTRVKLEAFLDGRPTEADSPHVRRVKAILDGAESDVAPPAPAFVEHVLFTAGRIAELANQIAHAAEKQLAASEDLGRRSQVELGARAPTAHHPPAKSPGKSGRNATPRDGA
jgi:hypothetical protein